MVMCGCSVVHCTYQLEMKLITQLAIGIMIIVYASSCLLLPSYFRTILPPARSEI